MTGHWQVYVADPSPLFRQGIRLMLETLDQPVQVEEAQWPEPLCSGEPRFDRGEVDLAILSARLFGANHLRQLREGALSKARILLMTEGSQPPMMIRAAIDGLIDKAASAEGFRRAIETLMDGGSWFIEGRLGTPPALPQGLSGKQQRVLALIREGRSNKQIAVRLHLSESTVKHHITRIYRLLAFDRPNRTLLALHGPAG